VASQGTAITTLQSTVTDLSNKLQYVSAPGREMYISDYAVWDIHPVMKMELK